MTSQCHQIYDFICKNNACLDEKICLTDYLGEGMSGTVYAATVSGIDTTVALKEHEPNPKHDNEVSALTFLRSKMLSGEIPPYYNFFFGQFQSGGLNYLILEHADTPIEKFLMTRPPVQTFLQIFWLIADAIDRLEKLQFNHGDLWLDNVYVSTKNGKIEIKLIDFDASYHKESRTTVPSFGGSDYRRHKFVLGYDLNRFFDNLLYSHTEFIRIKKENKLKKLRAYNRANKTKMTLDEYKSDDSDREFDDSNIVFPEQIVLFLQRLNIKNLNNFMTNVEMSGERIKNKIEELAKELKIKLK